jgi:type IV secretory pathway TraG/TraD family ATPase VirD4
LGVSAATGAEVVLSHEDHVLVKGPSGGGKSSAVLIPAALAAPGALVVTLTKTDVLDVIATRRAGVGRVWVFDPLGRSGWPEAMVWDPVAGCGQARRATARGLAFAAGLAAGGDRSANSAFFQGVAASTLTCLLHAAALSGRGVRDVIRWGVNLSNGAGQPQEVIRASADPGAQKLWADLLEGAATGADETVSSTRLTLQEAVRPLADTAVLRWCDPAQEGVAVFDPAAFVASRDTLVLISDANSATNVAPLGTMLFNEVIEEVKALAPTLPGDRLDPPLRIVGDEIANVAPLPKLPALASDARGYGVHLVIGVQADSQLEERWGAQGAATLTENLVAEVALPGIKSVRTLERLSGLVGTVEVREVTASYERGQRLRSESVGVSVPGES